MTQAMAQLPSPTIPTGNIPAGKERFWDGLPDMLSPDHLATFFNVDKKTISRWHREEGRLPHPTIKSGNVVRWQKQKVRDFLNRVDSMKS